MKGFLLTRPAHTVSAFLTGADLTDEERSELVLVDPAEAFVAGGYRRKRAWDRAGNSRLGLTGPLPTGDRNSPKRSAPRKSTTPTSRRSSR